MHTELLKSSKGFSLIEILVVFAIIVSIMSVVFTNQGSFNKSYVLANTAYDVALSLRNAETFGIGSRALGTIVNAGYGLHFDSNNNSSFQLFADTAPAASCTKPNCKPGNYAYTVGSDSLVRIYSLGNNITISDFCAYTTSWSCTYAHDGASGGLTSLDIVFVRPNPNPFMSGNGIYSQALPITNACLRLSSTQGTARYVSVSLAGEISPIATSCP